MSELQDWQENFTKKVSKMSNQELLEITLDLARPND